MMMGNEMKKDMVKITDVARVAGVSPSTVSHVLNGKRPISKQTRERVLTVIEELGYLPNPNAQALKSKRSGIIGFIAHDITELFVTKIIRGVEKVVRENDSYLTFTSGVEFNFDIRKAISFLERRRLDGIIISYEITLKEPLVGVLDQAIPIVTINRLLTDSAYSVLPDNIDGGYCAAEHLLEACSRHPAMIAGPKDRFASEERKIGFTNALLDNGFKPDSALIYHGDFNYPSGEQGIEWLFRQDTAIDGVFCANDYMAAGAIDGALKRGISIPDRLNVVGFDDRDFSSFGPIPISTFRQPLERMGHLSAEILFALINGKPPAQRKSYIKSTLIRRRSTGFGENPN